MTERDIGLNHGDGRKRFVLATELVESFLFESQTF